MSIFKPPTAAAVAAAAPAMSSRSLSFPTTHLKPHLRSPHRPRKPLTITSLFTGIVEEIGHVTSLSPSTSLSPTLGIAASTVLSDIHLGDSISINGVCLTVTDFTPDHFTVGLSPETLRKTSLSALTLSSPVNLERALQPISRMGGHFVQGHVDGTGEIVELTIEGNSLWVKVKTLPEIIKYVVPKGFISVDGTSLTVVRVYEEEGCFDFMLVAYTQEKVVVALKKVGDLVNLEVDILGKYVEKLLKSGVAVGGNAEASH